MTISTISCVNYICKQEKGVKRLCFGDRRNLINNAVSTGVVNAGPNPEELHNIPNHNTPSNAIQHDIVGSNEHDNDDTSVDVG